MMRTAFLVGTEMPRLGRAFPRESQGPGLRGFTRCRDTRGACRVIDTLAKS